MAQVKANSFTVHSFNKIVLSPLGELFQQSQQQQWTQGKFQAPMDIKGSQPKRPAPFSWSSGFHTQPLLVSSKCQCPRSLLARKKPCLDMGSLNFPIARFPHIAPDLKTGQHQMIRFSAKGYLVHTIQSLPVNQIRSIVDWMTSILRSTIPYINI